MDRAGPDAGARSTSAGSSAPSPTGSSTLQIDTRAAREVRRLSGGNQQKVTIARWVAGGVKTMLCFDPTRGIDIRTKQQIYVLLRDLAEAGAAVLLYTSELKEIQLVCDRAIVIFGGRVVAELAGADADEPALLRAAYDLKGDATLPEAIAAEVVAEAIAEASPTDADRPTPDGRRGDPVPTRRHRRTRDERRDRHRRRPRGRGRWTRSATGRGATPGRSACSASSSCCSCSRSSSSRPTGSPGIQGLAISVLPLALAAAAQAIVVISGGIDLSIALDHGPDQRRRRGPHEGPVRGVRRCVVVIGVLLLGLLIGAINGSLVVITRVPDIVVTLAMSFVWAGVTLLVLRAPGGGASEWLNDLVAGLDRAANGSPAPRSSSSSSSPSSGSRSVDRGSACRCTPSAATSWPRSAAASRSVGRRSWPTRSWACSPPSAA